MVDYVDLYERASAWTLDKVAGATASLDDPTPCDGWDVRTLLDHMLDTQRYFVESARGEDAAPIGSPPPHLLSGEPVADFARARAETIQVFGAPGVAEQAGPSVGIAFSDQLLHGWDVAKATGQDATMPTGLAELAYRTMHGRFTEAQRVGIFEPERSVDDDATPQAKLLAYTGRDPEWKA